MKYKYDSVENVLRSNPKKKFDIKMLCNLLPYNRATITRQAKNLKKYPDNNIKVTIKARRHSFYEYYPDT